MSQRPLIALLTLFSATTIASTAHAQPVGPEAAPKTGLSQINGTPIKVGEHSQYYYEYKKWNITGNPLGPIFGMYNLAVTRAISRHIAFTGEATVIAPSGTDEQMHQLSFTAPIYFKKMHQSFYIEPGMLMRKTVDSNDEDTFGPQLLVGWHWSWDSGANVQFAFGAGRDLNKSSEYGSDVFGVGYFRAGYAF